MDRSIPARLAPEVVAAVAAAAVPEVAAEVEVAAAVVAEIHSPR